MVTASVIVGLAVCVMLLVDWVVMEPRQRRDRAEVRAALEFHTAAMEAHQQAADRRDEMAGRRIVELRELTERVERARSTETFRRDSGVQEWTSWGSPIASTSFMGGEQARRDAMRRIRDAAAQENDG